MEKWQLSHRCAPASSFHPEILHVTYIVVHETKGGGGEFMNDFLL